MSNNSKYGDEALLCLAKKLAKLVEEKNITPSELAKEFISFDYVTRSRIDVMLRHFENKKTAQTISSALMIVGDTRVEEFKKAVEDGTYDAFLGILPAWPCLDKHHLASDLGLVKYGFSDEEPLTDLQKYYLAIIEKSIADDKDKAAKAQGFETYEEWQRRNRKFSDLDPEEVGSRGRRGPMGTAYCL